MKLPDFRGLMTVGKAFTMAHRPEILFGTSVVTTVAAVVAAARGGYKARGIIDAAQAERPEPLTRKEQVSLTWLCYLPAAGLTVGSLGATTGLHIVHVKEKKALAATALLAIEEVKKESAKYEKALHDAGHTIMTDEKSLEAAADEKGVTRVIGSDGEIEELYLVRDKKTGRDIWSNKARIEDALIELNSQLQGEGDAELNFFYTYAGFANTEDGGNQGWSGDRVTLKWGNTVRDDGRPVREFSFQPAPRLDAQSRAKS